MKLKRNADVDPLKVLGSFLLIGLVIIIIVIFFRSKLEAVAKSISPIEISSKNKLCEARGKLAENTLEKPLDQDKDGFPDDCDICLGGDNRQTQTNSLGIPDNCYADPRSINTGKKIGTYKEMCEANGGCYISDNDQCCIGDAKNKCGSKCK